MVTKRLTWIGRACVSLLSLTLSACGAPPFDPTADLAAIELVNARTLQALNEGDLQLLNEMTAENHIMMIPGRPELRGRDLVVEANANLIESWNIVEKWSPLETVVAGDIAYQRGEFDIDMTPKNNGVSPIRSTGKYLHIYQRQDDGNWLMIRDMFNSNSPD